LDEVWYENFSLRSKSDSFLIRKFVVSYWCVDVKSVFVHDIFNKKINASLDLLFGIAFPQFHAGQAPSKQKTLEIPLERDIFPH